MDKAEKSAVITLALEVARLREEATHRDAHSLELEARIEALEERLFGKDLSDKMPKGVPDEDD